MKSENCIWVILSILCIHLGVIYASLHFNFVHFTFTNPKSCLRSAFIGLIYYGLAQAIKFIHRALKVHKLNRTINLEYSKCHSFVLNLAKSSLAAFVFHLTDVPILAGLAYLTLYLLSLAHEFSPIDYDIKYRKFLRLYKIFNPGFGSNLEGKQNHVSDFKSNANSSLSDDNESDLNSKIRKYASMPILRKDSQVTTVDAVYSVSPKSELLNSWSWSPIVTNKSGGIDQSKSLEPKTIKKKLSSYTLNFEPNHTSVANSFNIPSTVDNSETVSLFSGTTTLYHSTENNEREFHNYKHFINFTQYYLDSCADFPIDPYYLKFGELMNSFALIKFIIYILARYLSIYAIVLSCDEHWVLLICMINSLQLLLPLDIGPIYLVGDLLISFLALFGVFVVKNLN